jgi:glycosyltransferase involved in cell wall biosynthesis
VLSVILITYERPVLLGRTLATVLNAVTYPRSDMEIILCDDGSSPAVQARMRELPCDLFLFESRNRGIGANTNRGVRAAHADLILQLQDDWACVGPSDFLDAAVELFGERPDVGFIRLREPFEGPFDSWTCRSGRRAQIYHNRPRWRATTGEYVYTDTPHIKRASFHQRLGPYCEGRPMHVTEMNFCRRFEAQSDLKAAFIEGYRCFVHIGDGQSFNPLRRPRRWRARLDAWQPTFWMIRHLRRIKHRVIGRVADRLRGCQ